MVTSRPREKLHNGTVERPASPDYDGYTSWASQQYSHTPRSSSSDRIGVSEEIQIADTAAKEMPYLINKIIMFELVFIFTFARAVFGHSFWGFHGLNTISGDKYKCK